MNPPTIGDIVAELRDTREALQAITTGIKSGEPTRIGAAALLASVTAEILGGLLDRIDAPPDTNQPRDVSRRPNFN